MIYAFLKGLTNFADWLVNILHFSAISNCIGFCNRILNDPDDGCPSLFLSINIEAL